MDPLPRANNQTNETLSNILRFQRIPKLVPFVDGEPKMILLLSYQRSGSTFLGNVLLMNHPDIFYVYEPLDGTYCAMYGTQPGMNIPDDITTYPNGSDRYGWTGDIGAKHQFVMKRTGPSPSSGFCFEVILKLSFLRMQLNHLWLQLNIIYRLRSHNRYCLASLTKIVYLSLKWENAKQNVSRHINKILVVYMLSESAKLCQIWTFWKVMAETFFLTGKYFYYDLVPFLSAINYVWALSIYSSASSPRFLRK